MRYVAGHEKWRRRAEIGEAVRLKVNRAQIISHRECVKAPAIILAVVIYRAGNQRNVDVALLLQCMLA